ncbi:MAG: VOC family protein [bacterium]|nr:VOC family protein [bacterium]
MLDHLLWGVPDLERGVHDFAEATGVRAAAGGRHAGVGTQRRHRAGQT